MVCVRGYLQEQSLISLYDRLVPLDDIREGQLPAVAQEQRDARRLNTSTNTHVRMKKRMETRGGEKKKKSHVPLSI